MLKRQCIGCGEGFGVVNPRRVYCSESCRKRARDRRYDERHADRRKAWYERNRERQLAYGLAYRRSRGIEPRVVVIERQREPERIRKSNLLALRARTLRGREWKEAFVLANPEHFAELARRREEKREKSREMERARDRVRKRAQRRRQGERLTDGAVRRMLKDAGVPAGAITPPLIEAKRAVVRVKRLLRQRSGSANEVMRL